MSAPLTMPCPPTAQLGGLVVLALIFAGCGGADEQAPPRMLGPQVHLSAVDGLESWPALLAVPYVEAEYAVHLPASTESGAAGTEFAELVFALNSSGYEMPEMLLGEAHDGEDWIRIGFVQRVEVCPLGRRSLGATDAAPRITGRIGGVDVVGEPGEFELVGDLKTGVARGYVSQATLRPAAGDGDAISFSVTFEGVFQRRCTERIYVPGLPMVETPITGAPDCRSVFGAIDGQADPEPPVLPPWPIEIADGQILYPDGRME